MKVNKAGLSEIAKRGGRSDCRRAHHIVSNGRSTPIILDSDASVYNLEDERYIYYTVDIEPLTIELANSTTVATDRRRLVRMEMGLETPRLRQVYLIPERKLRSLSSSPSDDRGTIVNFVRDE